MGDTGEKLARALLELRARDRAGYEMLASLVLHLARKSPR